MCPSCGQWSKFWCGPHSMDGRVVAILKLITSFPFPMHSVGKTFFFHNSNQMGNWWFSNLWPHGEYDVRRHHCMYPFQVMSDVSIFLFSPDEAEGQIASLLRSTFFQIIFLKRERRTALTSETRCFQHLDWFRLWAPEKTYLKTNLSVWVRHPQSWFPCNRCNEDLGSLGSHKKHTNKHCWVPMNTKQQEYLFCYFTFSKGAIWCIAKPNNWYQNLLLALFFEIVVDLEKLKVKTLTKSCGEIYHVCFYTGWGRHTQLERLVNHP